MCDTQTRSEATGLSLEWPAHLHRRALRHQLPPVQLIVLGSATLKHSAQQPAVVARAPLACTRGERAEPDDGRYISSWRLQLEVKG